MPKRFILAIRLLAAGALLAPPLAVAAPAKPTPAAHPAPRASPAAARAPLHHAAVNSHLHLKPAAYKAVKASAPKHPQATKTTTTTTVVHHWTRNWHYAEWATLHRGTGTIVGRVVSKSGALVRGASLILRKPNGKMFKHASAKHVTRTGRDGRFVMRNVRIGTYRVRAHDGKPAGHVNVHVHGGQTAAVQVQI